MRPATRPRVQGWRVPASHTRLPPPRPALGFNFPGPGADDDDSAASLPGLSTGAVRPPRPVAAAVDSLLLLRGSMFDGEGDAPGAAAAAFLRAVAAPPSTRGDGTAVAASAAALATALTARTPVPPSWRAWLADAAIVGRNNGVAAAAARGDTPSGAAAAALSHDLRILTTLAFTGAEAESWADTARQRAAPGWAAALGGVVGGGDDAGGAAWPAPPRRRATLHPPLTRADRAARTAHLLSLSDWSDATDALIATWSACGAGNVGSFALFEWAKGRLTPAAEDSGGGDTDDASAPPPHPWADVAAAAASWAADDAATPCADGRHAVLVEAGESTTSLWGALCRDATLLASGARLVRVPGGSSADWRGLARACRAHPRARWVAVCDGVVGGDADAGAVVRGGVAPNVALVAVRS